MNDSKQIKADMVAKSEAEGREVRRAHKARIYAEKDLLADAAAAQLERFGEALRTLKAAQTPEQAEEGRRRHAEYVASLGLNV